MNNFMLIARGIPNGSFGSVALTIGNFDGVHLGHQALLKKLREKASYLGLPACVLTFEPHPRAFFSPETVQPRLMSIREKLQWLQFYGVDRVHLCRFNRNFANLSAQDFIEKILVRGLKVRSLLIGDDFRFGIKRSGDFDLLQREGQQRGFVVERLTSVLYEGKRISSSLVRDALIRGNAQQAKTLLGRPYSVHGRVVHGDKLGRELGFATANIHLPCMRALAHGIYIVQVRGIEDRQVDGVASLGLRPTINETGKETLEIHLFDFNGDLYGRHLCVDFLERIRAEEKYESLELLKTQIAKDVEVAKSYFRTRVG